MTDVKRSVIEAHKMRTALCSLSLSDRNRILEEIIVGLQSNADYIVLQNRIDLANASADNISQPLIKRLKFQHQKIQAVIEGIRATIALPDPLNAVLEAREMDAELNLYRIAVPIGVVGFIFESRPDALVQIATLAIKSGNVAIVKGGSEAEHTNNALVNVIKDAIAKCGVSTHILCQLNSREQIAELLELHDYVDLIIPRGSNEFVKSITERSMIPVLGHADGVCHIFVDTDADLSIAARVVIDAKTQYPAVCNAIETLLVHSSVVETVLQPLVGALIEHTVELFGCARTVELFPHTVAPLSTDNWSTEYLDLKLSIKIVDSIDEAIEHINQYGSHHTDAIITQSDSAKKLFMSQVDSATVVHNASTRFADGYRFGLGAEIGIATGKIHARGPVGIGGLTTYKWQLYGNGQVVSDYEPPNQKKYTHKPLNGAIQ